MKTIHKAQSAKSILINSVFIKYKWKSKRIDVHPFMSISSCRHHITKSFLYHKRHTYENIDSYSHQINIEMYISIHTREGKIVKKFSFSFVWEKKSRRT